MSSLIEKLRSSVGIATKASQIPIEWLATMNDEEVMAEFMGLNARFARSIEDAETVVQEMAKRGLRGHETSVMFLAMTQLRKTGDGESSGDPANKSTNDNGDQASGDSPSIDIPYVVGPEGAVVAFVGASLSPIDKARCEHFTGPAGATMRDLYLSAIRKSRDEIVLAAIVPVLLMDERDKPREPTDEEVAEHLPYFWKAMNEKGVTTVVALGKTARQALGDDATMWVPHPLAVRHNSDTGEVSRKLGKLRTRLRKAIEERVKAEVTVKVEAEPLLKYTILKADDEKQLITGVVMEPDIEDTQGDITNADEIEKAAHFYLLNSRVVGDEHTDIAADVEVVESYIAPDDMTVEGQEVRKGSWLMTVHVASSDRWAQVKKGEYTGFSIGAVARRVAA